MIGAWEQGAGALRRNPAHASRKPYRLGQRRRNFEALEARHALTSEVLPTLTGNSSSFVVIDPTVTEENWLFGDDGQQSQQPGAFLNSDSYGGEPYGGDPYGGDPYGGYGGDPYGSDPYGGYGGDPYGGDPYGGYGGDPYGGDPYGGYGGDPYGGDPYGGDPYGGYPYGGDPYGGDPYGGYGGDPYGGDPYGGDPYGGSIAPNITAFDALYLGNGAWRIFGTVSDDEEVAGLNVILSGLASVQCAVDSDHAFSTILNGIDSIAGWLFADFTDLDGLAAQRASLEIT